MHWGKPLVRRHFTIRHLPITPASPHLGLEANVELDCDTWKHFQLGKGCIKVPLT